MWEPSLLGLLARLAEDASGLVDWGPALPVVFTRVQKMFGLPVHYNKTNVGYKGQQLDSNTAARWVVNTLGGGGKTQEYLGQLLFSLESYYHPANTGKYILKLTEFLARIVEAFIKRVHRERHRKPSWGYRPSSEAQLTDTDITDFVVSIKPVVFHAMWLRCLDVGTTLQSLATLRPALILPTLVQRLYAALDTVTEPHKFTASLFSVVGVARCLVQHTPEYPEGQTHVLPLLFATLPGIDTNDLRKSMVTFQFISTFATFISFVDNSVEAASLKDISEEEAKVYAQSAHFEDFIVEFLNRCFAIIENSEVQQIRSEVSTDDASVSREDTMKDVGMTSTFSAILIQSSESLYDVALKKVRNWLSGRIMEWKVSGKIAAGLCRCLTKVRPERGLAGLLPSLLTSVEGGLGERQGEETLGDEIKFQLMVLAELVRVPGNCLLPYLARLENILTNLSKHSSKEGDLLTGALLKNVLRSLTHVFPVEYKSVVRGFDQDLSTYRPLQDWGVAGDVQDLGILWYEPGQEEVEAAQRLVTVFLGDTLVRLQQCSNGEVGILYCAGNVGDTVLYWGGGGYCIKLGRWGMGYWTGQRQIIFSSKVSYLRTFRSSFLCNAMPYRRS
jgi:proteasome activator subunit 4